MTRIAAVNAVPVSRLWRRMARRRGAGSAVAPPVYRPAWGPGQPRPSERPAGLRDRSELGVREEISGL